MENRRDVTQLLKALVNATGLDVNTIDQALVAVKKLFEENSRLDAENVRIHQDNMRLLGILREAGELLQCDVEKLVSNGFKAIIETLAKERAKYFNCVEDVTRLASFIASDARIGRKPDLHNERYEIAAERYIELLEEDLQASKQENERLEDVLERVGGTLGLYVESTDVKGCDEIVRRAEYVVRNYNLKGNIEQSLKAIERMSKRLEAENLDVESSGAGLDSERLKKAQSLLGRIAFAVGGALDADWLEDNASETLLRHVELAVKGFERARRLTKECASLRSRHGTLQQLFDSTRDDYDKSRRAMTLMRSEMLQLVEHATRMLDDARRRFSDIPDLVERTHASASLKRSEYVQEENEQETSEENDEDDEE